MTQETIDQYVRSGAGAGRLCPARAGHGRGDAAIRAHPRHRLDLHRRGPAGGTGVGLGVPPVNSVALGLARQIRDGERSASAVLEATLARIREADPRYHCFTSVTETRARQEAAAIDARRARGEVLPPLAGVPYAVKNLFDTADEVTLAGGRVNAANPPARRDAVLRRGCARPRVVLVGALNMDEHAYGFTTENSHYGACRNPHDPARIAGGSSAAAPRR